MSQVLTRKSDLRLVPRQLAQAMHHSSVDEFLGPFLNAGFHKERGGSKLGKKDSGKALVSFAHVYG